MLLLLKVGLLIDGTGGPARKEQSVLIDGDRIARIGPWESMEAPDAQVLDLSGSTLLPGLIDLHTHMGLFPPKRGEGADPSLRKDDLIAVKVFQSAFAGQAWLQSGVTTVRHAGGGGNFAVAIKEAIAEGYTAGPRVIASGSIITQTGGVRAGNEHFGIEITGVDEARRAARQQLKAGVDVLKIYGASSIGGGGGRLVSHSGWEQMTLEEMRAIVEEAHRPGRLASVHTGDAVSIKKAIQSGADWLDHATFLDDEAIDMLLKTNTPIVPTRAAGWSFAEYVTFGPYIAKMGKQVDAQTSGALAKAYRAGVRIATGTDTVHPDAGVAKECELLCQVGMSAQDAIVAATSEPARILGLADQIGTVEENKIADLVVLDANPLDDIRNLARNHVEMVIQGGRTLALPLVDLSAWS